MILNNIKVLSAGQIDLYKIPFYLTGMEKYGVLFHCQYSQVHSDPEWKYL